MPRENALLPIGRDSAPGTETAKNPEKGKDSETVQKHGKKKLRKQKRLTIRQKVIKRMTEETCL